jgi:type VII secretion-associated serine protease mycosin
VIRLLGVALAATFALAPTAAAQPDTSCRSAPPAGTDLPATFGPHPLIEKLGLVQAWDLATGAGVTVAVVDSGVGTHPKLTGAVDGGAQFARGDFPQEFAEQRPAEQVDCAGHGTAVAGLIAARRAGDGRIAGVAPGARIFPVRLVEDVASTTPATMAAAITAAANSGARVLNLSLATSVDRQEIHDAINYALGRDIVVVAAAGNESETGRPIYPAAYDGVIAVGAIDYDGKPMDESNRGDWVDLAAYGKGLVVPAPGSGYREESGTSFAAAEVSGTAALVRSRFPAMAADQVRDALVSSAVPVSGGTDDRTGAGVVDPFEALTRAGHATTKTPTTRAVGVPVAALRQPAPALSTTALLALVWSAGLVAAVPILLCTVPALRRAAARRWRAGPLPNRPHRKASNPPMTTLD